MCRPGVWNAGSDGSVVFLDALGAPRPHSCKISLFVVVGHRDLTCSQYQTRCSKSRTTNILSVGISQANSHETLGRGFNLLFPCLFLSRVLRFNLHKGNWLVALCAFRYAFKLRGFSQTAGFFQPVHMRLARQITFGLQGENC